MKLLDSGIRVLTRRQGTGVRWLKEELSSLNVKIPLSEGCLDELARAADSAAWQAVAGAADGSKSYLGELRQELREQAGFVQRWTGTDDKVSSDERAQAFVRIARKYALPRPWKLSEPVAVESDRLRPSSWKWASAIEAFEAARSVA